MKNLSLNFFNIIFFYKEILKYNFYVKVEAFELITNFLCNIIKFINIHTDSSNKDSIKK
jgi:hypothetical protein